MDAMEPTTGEIAENELSSSVEIKKGYCECPKNSNVVVKTDASESGSLNKFKMPSGRYGFPRNNPYSTSNGGTKVEDLTQKKFTIPDLNIVSSSNNTEGMSLGHGQWQHLYNLGSGPRRNPTSIQDNREQNEVNASKIASPSGFSHFLVKQPVKGKAVLSKEEHSSLDGIKLREWLRPHKEINKVERLRLFKQIVQIVDFAHSQGVVLQDLRPSCFIILPANRVKYVGSSIPKEKLSITNDTNRKRQLEQFKFGVKKQKSEIGSDISSLRHFDYANSNSRNSSRYQNIDIQAQQERDISSVQLEKNWYASPVELNASNLMSSNIYALGILLFELLCSFESFEIHSGAMLDLQQRILPPKFLSENPKEAGFCLWLLHPKPSSRPTTREILDSELMCGYEEINSGVVDLSSSVTKADDEESKLLNFFLNSLKEQKQKHESKLLENLEFLEEDIKEIEKRHTLKLPSDRVNNGLSESNRNKLEDAYIHKRSEINSLKNKAIERPDKDLLRNRFQTENEGPIDRLKEFYEGICKYTRYNKFEICGTLRNVDLVNSTNVICSLSFDRDEEYIAAAGVSKKIKVFEYDSLLKKSTDIHYPLVEMPNKSKLSCVSWNKYIKNYLASTDYDGVVQMWDASTGQGFSQYAEHQKRAWSVDFSQADPMKFASGSDDCYVKLWNINEKDSVSTIRSPANVCCVQFSDYSPHILAFGSADFKIYAYDIRHTRIPWCTLAGHGKTVSYVKFLDSETLVSASTDNTLKLWDLNKTNSEGLSSNACISTFTGHTNEKNFVGLSVHDGYISCGSETNEVYAYYRSLPMPITSHRFGCVDPVTGQEINDANGQFVSSVCWRGKSNTVVAANSTGSIKILQMV